MRRFALVLIAIILFACLWACITVARSEVLYVCTVNDYANIRERPDKESVDAGDLPAGEIVNGIGYQNGWVLIEASVEAGQGWVRADLLTLADHPTGRYTNISGGRVRMRRDPDGETIGWLSAKHSVNVIRWVDVDGVAWAYTAKGYIDGTWLEVEP